MDFELLVWNFLYLNYVGGSLSALRCFLYSTARFNRSRKMVNSRTDSERTWQVFVLPVNNVFRPAKSRIETRDDLVSKQWRAKTTPTVLVLTQSNLFVKKEQTLTWVAKVLIWFYEMQTDRHYLDYDGSKFNLAVRPLKCGFKVTRCVVGIVPWKMSLMRRSLTWKSTVPVRRHYGNRNGSNSKLV